MLRMVLRLRLLGSSQGKVPFHIRFQANAVFTLPASGYLKEDE